MSSITIKDITKEVTAWAKDITFEREGKTYSVTLYWNNWDGYDITFHNKTNSTPAWANEWQDSTEGAESLEYNLDSLTEKEGE